MAGMHKAGISSFSYCFACGSRAFQRPRQVMTPLDLIGRAAALGAGAVQFGDNMPLEKCSMAELRELRAYAEACGIEPEAGMRGATRERISDYIRITREIGGSLLRLVIDGPGFEPGSEEFCGILCSVIPELEESGVVLGIENHDRFHSCEYAQMVETVCHPQIGLTVDVTNSLSQEERTAEVLQNMAPYCVCLHVKDYEIRRYNGGGGLKITGAALGTGKLDLRRCYEECRDRSGRDFNVILESWMEPCETVEETLRKEDEWARAGMLLLNSLVADRPIGD